MEEGGVSKREETRHVNHGALYGDSTLDSVNMEIHQDDVSRIIIPYVDKSAQYQKHLPRGGVIDCHASPEEKWNCCLQSIRVRDGAMPGGKEQSDESFSS
jgi:hypothetical protein